MASERTKRLPPCPIAERRLEKPLSAEEIAALVKQIMEYLTNVNRCGMCWRTR